MKFGKIYHCRYNSCGHRTNEFSFPYIMSSYDVALIHKVSGFDRKNYYGDQTISLYDTMAKEASTKCDHIQLRTNLNWLGTQFNSISIYLVSNKGKLVVCILEVHNTPFGEKILYKLRIGHDGSIDKRDIVQNKKMHVSLFSPSKRGKYTFHLEVEDNRLFLSVLYRIKREKILFASLLLNKELPEIKIPMGIYSLVLIYYEAFKLFLKGMPFYEIEKIDTDSTQDTIQK